VQTDACTLDGHLYRVTYTRCRNDTIYCPDDEHMAARNMLRIEINIYGTRIVRQVGYLQGIYVPRCTVSKASIFFFAYRMRPYLYAYEERKS